MEKYILSILVPVYNAGELLRRCLESITIQKSFDDTIEIVIVNDGSVDNSYTIISEFCDRFNNIISISRENKGIGATRNELLDNAHGEYFWFIDADDYIDEHALDTVLPLLRSDIYDMLMMGYYWGTEFNGRVISCKGEFQSALDMTAHDIYNNSLWTRVYRTSIVRKYHIRFQQYQMGEDFDVIFKMIPYVRHCKCISQPLYNYIVNPHSAVTDTSKQHVYKSSDDSLACLEDNYGWLQRFDSHTQNILRKPLVFFLMGYLYSIYVVPFSLRYKLAAMRRLKEMGAFPIRPLPQNRKQKYFSKLMNLSFIRIISIYLNVIYIRLRNKKCY